MLRVLSLGLGWDELGVGKGDGETAKLRNYESVSIFSELRTPNSQQILIKT